MDFHSLKRKSLQALCKKHNIPANTTNLQMADTLASLLKNQELGQSEGLDGSGIRTIEKTEFKGGTRRAKKVRFCLEEEQNGFIDLTKSEDGSSVGKCEQKCKNLGIRESPKAGKGVAVRVTRSKRGTRGAMIDSSSVERKNDIIVLLSSPENTKSRGGKVEAGEMEKAGLDDGSRVDAEVIVLSSSSVEKTRTRSRGKTVRADYRLENMKNKQQKISVEKTRTKSGGKTARADYRLENVKNKQQKIPIEDPTQLGKGPTKNTLKPEEKAPRRSKRKSSIIYNSVIPEETELLLKEKVDAREIENQMISEESEEPPKPVKPRRRSLRIALRGNTSDTSDLQLRIDVVIQKTAPLEVERECIHAHELEQANSCLNKNVPSFRKSDMGLSGTVGKEPYYNIMSGTEEPPRTSNSQASILASAKNEERASTICSFGFENIVEEVKDVAGLQQDAEVVQQLETDLVDLKQDAVLEIYGSPNAASRERIRKTSVLLERTSEYKGGKNVIEADSIGTSPRSYDVVEDAQDANCLQEPEQELVNHNKEAVSELPTVSVFSNVNLIETFIGELQELVSYSLGITSVQSSPISEASNPFDVTNKEELMTINNSVLVNIVTQRDEAECLPPAQEGAMQDAAVLPQLNKDPTNDIAPVTLDTISDGSDATIIKTDEFLVDNFDGKMGKNVVEDAIGQQQAQKEHVDNDKDNLFDKLIEEFEELVSDSLQIISARTSTLLEAFSPSDVKTNENEQTYDVLNRFDLTEEEKYAESSQCVSEVMTEVNKGNFHDMCLDLSVECDQQIFQAEEGLVGEAVNHNWFSGKTVAENDSGSFNIEEVVAKHHENCEFQNNDIVTEDEKDAMLSLVSEEFGATVERNMLDEFSVLQKSHRVCQVVHATETEVKENAEIIHRKSDGKNSENGTSVSVLEEEMQSLTPGPEFPFEYTDMHPKLNIKKDEEDLHVFLGSAEKPYFQPRVREVLSQVNHYSYIEEFKSIDSAVVENEEIAFSGEGTNISTSQQVLQQLGILHKHIDRDGEADGYAFSTVDYPIHESYEDKLEMSSGNKKNQIDLTNVMGSFREKIMQFSCGSEIQLGSAVVVQGNKIAACVQNKSPGEPLEEEKVGEAVLPDKFNDTNRDKDYSLPFTESWMDRSYSCYNFGEDKTRNEYQLESGSDAVADAGDETQINSSLEGCNNVKFDVNMTDEEEEKIESSLTRLFAVEQPELNVKRRRPCSFTIQRTPMGSSGQLQGHLSASGMKENIRNSKTEKSSNCKVEKPLTKRRALDNLQNSLNR